MGMEVSYGRKLPAENLYRYWWPLQIIQPNDCRHWFILVIKQIIWVPEVYSNLHPSLHPQKEHTHKKRKEKRKGYSFQLTSYWTTDCLVAPLWDIRQHSLDRRECLHDWHPKDHGDCQFHRHHEECSWQAPCWTVHAGTLTWQSLPRQNSSGLGTHTVLLSTQPADSKTRMRLLTEVPSVYTHAKISCTHVKNHAVHVRVWWIMETHPKKKQPCTKSDKSLQNVEAGHYSEDVLCLLFCVLWSLVVDIFGCYIHRCFAVKTEAAENYH